MLELTTRFEAITTSAVARRGTNAQKAVRSAAAYLAYIDRSSAVGERGWSGIDAGSSEAQRSQLRKMIQDRAKLGGKNGSRILEKGIISLPNSWPSEARQEACQRIADHLAPVGSDAAALVVSHRDRARNEHLHFAAVDGLESWEAARSRCPKAQRVRRAQVIRLGDKGRPKKLRIEIAKILNAIAQQRGLEGVEWRSFEERGIAHKPGRHDGPQRRARIERESTQEIEAWFSRGLNEPGNLEWLDHSPPFDHLPPSDPCRLREEDGQRAATALVERSQKLTEARSARLRQAVVRRQPIVSR